MGFRYMRLPEHLLPPPRAQFQSRATDHRLLIVGCIREFYKSRNHEREVEVEALVHLFD